MSSISSDESDQDVSQVLVSTRKGVQRMRVISSSDEYDEVEDHSNHSLDVVDDSLDISGGELDSKDPSGSPEKTPVSTQPSTSQAPAPITPMNYRSSITQDVYNSNESDDSDVIENASNEEDNISSNEIITNASNEEDNISSNEIITNASNDEDNISSNEIITKSPSKGKEDVISLSSDCSSDVEEEMKNLKPSANSTVVQTDLRQFLEKKPQREPLKLQVTSDMYNNKVSKIGSMEAQLSAVKLSIKTTNLSQLPDKGKLLYAKLASLTRAIDVERANLAQMVVVKDEGEGTLMGAKEKVQVAWDKVQVGVDAVVPKTFGKQGMQNFNAQRQLTVERLEQLHQSLKTCPGEADESADPRGLKVALMPHQRRALAWMLWREQEKPRGGILADDMGLGKTLTLISLVLRCQQLDDRRQSEKENERAGGTLVVCPASLLQQWSGEVERRTKRGLLSVEIYHGAKRETSAKRLAEHDMVITTYSIAGIESERNGTLFRVKWARIILDEAHQIRNPKTQMSVGVCALAGKRRWALTGTPVHNKELDMYALLKFLRCSPFDDYSVWKHWVADKSTGGQERLHALISTMMLRRTKAELMLQGSLKSLPERKWELLEIKLDKDETEVYQRVLIFSQKLFAQFLHQRAEKNQDLADQRFTSAPADPNGEYFKMRNRLLKLNKVKEVSQHEILVLLLRLRQVCCHPSLITAMLQGDEDLGENEDSGESAELNLLEQLNRLDLDDDDHGDGRPADGASEQAVGLKEATKGFLNPSNPVFSETRKSSKMKKLMEVLKEKVSTGDKAIVVSQWTSLLKLLKVHMKEANVQFDSLDGSIPVNKRMPIVDGFNDPRNPTRVLLLSLTAGGVGLNLVGANHLFLLDLHWNPQLENQAQDRIYRVGQEKPIYVYKFMAVDTIEQRIKLLQEKKLAIADSMLTGSRQVINSKLSIQDLKLLFNFA